MTDTALTARRLEKAVVDEKLRGTPDVEIGRKYGVTFRYIERAVTRHAGVNVSVLSPRVAVRRWEPPDFREETTTVWSFRRRGKWATHDGKYRGNWSPYIPRNVILKYSRPGETVLDCFCGAGTTMVEAKLLGRKGVALDVNPTAIALAKENAAFSPPSTLFSSPNGAPYEPRLKIGDARKMDFLEDESVDLVCTHPPYADIVQYTDNDPRDMSRLGVEDFLAEMQKVAEECWRVLKPGRKCAVLIGDMRKQKRVVPLGFRTMDVFMKAGFRLHELIIKRQHNCKTTGFWYNNSIKHNFLLLAHEHLPIFEKPEGRPARVRERGMTYGGSVDAESFRKPRQTKPLETTTVWILSEDDPERHLRRNIAERYSPHVVVSGVHCQDPRIIRDKALDAAARISKKGFVAVHVRDAKHGKNVIPMAKHTVDVLNNDLILKEIVVVLDKNTDSASSNGVLDVSHSYLLIYEKQEQKHQRN